MRSLAHFECVSALYIMHSTMQGFVGLPVGLLHTAHYFIVRFQHVQDGDHYHRTRFPIGFVQMYVRRYHVVGLPVHVASSIGYV